MKFGYTILYVNDVEKSVTFYESAFNLKRHFIHESGYGEMLTGDTKLAFAQIELAASNGVPFTPASTTSPPPGVEIAFVTDDVPAAFTKAVAAGADPISHPTQKPWGQIVSYVRDLNGFLVELCSPIPSTLPVFLIRKITRRDTPVILELSESLGFGPEELKALQKTFDEYHDRNHANGYQSLACFEEETLVGIIYFAPMEMTDRTWEVIMIVVESDRQREGIGSRLLLAAEQFIQSENGRMIVIETSTSPDQIPARRFYRKHGYSGVAEIPDAFSDGEGKSVFMKRIQALNP